MLTPSYQYLGALVGRSGSNSSLQCQQSDRAHPQSHLVIAGGVAGPSGNATLIVLEILNLNTLQWSSAGGLPRALLHPMMTHLYLSKDGTIFSCSVDQLKSCKPAPTNSSDGGSMWTRICDIPVSLYSHLATLRTHPGSRRK